FHQGWQQQHGDGAILAGILNILAELQARAEPHLLHFEIAARQRQFLAQSNAVARARAPSLVASAAIECRLLKRKCGLICMRKACNSASRASVCASATARAASRASSAASAA